MSVREYSGNAKTTKLNGAISNTDTALTLVDGTGYPTGATGPFVITIDATLAGEEKLLCTSRSGNNVTVTTRGYDGTTASAHDNQASVQHTISAVDLREANAHNNAPTGAHAASMISYAGSTNLSSTNVEAALDELDAEKAPTGHTHAASAITYAGSTNLSSANVEAALDELDAEKLGLPTAATIATLESYSSSTYGDLATAGPAVTRVVGASGMALVILSCNSYGDTNGTSCSMGCAVSGATTRAATDAEALVHYSDVAPGQMTASSFRLLTGLTPGSTTFTAKYASNGTANFRYRQLIVIPI